MPGAGAPAATPTRPVATIPSEELSPQLPPNDLDVHEITVTTSIAVVLLELPAGGLAEIGNGGEIGNDGTAGVESALESLQGRCGLFFFFELNVDVSNHVVGKIVANVEALDLPKLAQLLEDILVEILEMFLDLSRVDWLPLRVYSWGNHVRPLVHVGEEERRRDRGPIMEPRAPVTVPASPDLEVEGAVHAVLLCPEDRGQVLRHC